MQEISEKRKKRLLLHICCAPDATVGFDRLSGEYDVAGLFYNPNIHPREEFERRLDSMKVLAGHIDIEWIEGDYDPRGWFESVRGLEEEPEKGRRCEVCIRDRLMSTARTAKQKGFEAFSAVFSVSPHKNADLIDRLGREAEEKYGVSYVRANFKKQDGFRESIRMSRKYGLYRQNYCGCRFSEKGTSRS